MYKRVDRRVALARRHQRVRKDVFGTAERPRMSVFRSHAHIYVQIIDDTVGRTLVSASSVEPEIRAKAGYGGNIAAAGGGGGGGGGSFIHLARPPGEIV